ncbi:MAG: glutamine--fructose-6-phosphate transaminase (isomerizing) [Candidatus Diapherotrites archaeon]|nr:glutamine--fructose-6-phosphate transaminase (isomerizing) [Candidatus Diapherotrites archaeon]
MCGIVGVISEEQNAGILAYKALKKLDYRGYDSWGIAISNGKGISIYRQVGKIGELPKKMHCGNLAVAHTRWATHGKVCQKNTHPHASLNKNIFLVHNGIVENFQELKSFLKSSGFSFRSDTDTEVIPNLIELYINRGKSLRDATRLALKKIKGSFAVILFAKGHNYMIAAKRDLPLVIGIAERKKFVASDLLAIAKKARGFLFLSDNEIAEIGNEAKFFDIGSGRPKFKRFEHLAVDNLESYKNGNKHYMIKEIKECPIAMKNACIQPIELLDNTTKEIRKAKKIFLIGCGTSYHAALFGAWLFRSIAKKDAVAVLAPDLKSYSKLLGKAALVVALSQSGETADVIDAVRLARRSGAKILSLTNVFNSTLTRHSHIKMMMNAGPEICVASTKNYAAQISLLYLLANACISRRNYAKKEIFIAAKQAQETIRENSRIARAISKKLANSKSAFVIGSEENAFVAFEGALKIKEVSYIHAEGLPAKELKHGTIALVEKGLPVIVICTKSDDFALHSAHEVKSRGAFVIGISTEKNNVFDFFIRVPRGPLSSLLTAIQLQLIAYYLAVERKNDPDKPRNLAKSVTVR